MSDMGICVNGRSYHWYPVYRGSREQVSFYVSQQHGDVDIVHLYVDVIDSLGSTRHALNASVFISLSSSIY